jgi:CRP/FNR family transcriptional regulator
MTTLSREEILKSLGDSYYFKGLPGQLLEEIADIGVVKHYEKGEEIFGEGERAYGFFYVIEGLVKIYKLSSKGKEQIIHLFGRGEIFAEVVLAGQELYPAYAQAVAPTDLLFFEKKRLLTLLQRRHDLCLNLIVLFAQRLRMLVRQIENLTLRDAGERLLLYLWDLSQNGAKTFLPLEITKSQLALLLGITPETLSRLFQKFKNEGILELKGKEIFLRSPEALKKLISTL